jgi:transposase
MAYITVRKNREGKSYVYLVEGYRQGDKVRSRILKSYGQLEKLEVADPGALERLKKEAKAGTLPEIQTLRPHFQVTYGLDTSLHFEDKIYGWKVLEDVYQMLGLSKVLSKYQGRKKFSLDTVLQLLVFQRILRPASKCGTAFSQPQLFGDWSVSKNEIYRSLSTLSQAKEALQFATHQAISSQIGRSAALVFYDVTNYYFQIDQDDKVFDDEGNNIGMRRRGPNKEHRPLPIVQLGLFMDSNGIPITYKLFRGNEVDVSTYLPALEEVKQQFGIERLIIVADKAMNSQNNVFQNCHQGDGWLFSQKHRGRRGAPKDIQSFLLDAAGWEFNEKEDFAKKSMIRERKLTRKDEETITVREKVLVTWSEKYALREKIRRDGALAYAEKLTDAEIFRQTCKKGGKKYLELYSLDSETGEKKAFAPFIAVNEDELSFDAQFDGMNVLVTSELEMSDEAMLDHYHELSRIEDCFRVTKSELEARPVFVQKPEHIEAHFLTCFLALVILRIIQHKSGWLLSPKRMIDALNNARCNPLAQGYYRVQGTEDLVELQKALGIKWEKQYVKLEELKRYAKGWCTTSNS